MPAQVFFRRSKILADMRRTVVATITGGRYESERRAIGWFLVGNERAFSTVARAEIGVRDHGNHRGISLILRMDVFARATRIGASQALIFSLLRENGRATDRSLSGPRRRTLESRVGYRP
jgi:hypothetical protein